MNRRNAALAGLSAAGLAVTALQLPAEAAPTEQALASATVSKSCTFSAKGETLRINLKLSLGPNGRDVQGVKIRATDNDESGSYDNGDVRIKRVRLVIIDQDGKQQLSNTVSPSSPGSYDIGSAGEGAGKVTVKVRWRTHGSTVDKACSKVID